MTLNRRKLLLGVASGLALAADRMPAWAIDLEDALHVVVPARAEVGGQRRDHLQIGVSQPVHALQRPELLDAR